MGPNRKLLIAAAGAFLAAAAVNLLGPAGHQESTPPADAPNVVEQSQVGEVQP